MARRVEHRTSAHSSIETRVCPKTGEPKARLVSKFIMDLQDGPVGCGGSLQENDLVVSFLDLVAVVSERANSLADCGRQQVEREVTKRVRHRSRRVRRQSERNDVGVP